MDYLYKPEWGIGERNEGNVGNQGGNDGEMRGIRVRMMGKRGIRVEMRGTGGENEGNKGDDLRVGVDLMNDNRGEGQK